MSLSRSLRLLAVGGLLPLLAACTSVGLGAQTGQVYIPADGANNRTGTVYVLNAVVVSGRVGAGTLVTTFVDTDTQSPDTVSSITGTGLTVTGTLPTVPAGGHVNLATIAADLRHRHRRQGRRLRHPHLRVPERQPGDHGHPGGGHHRTVGVDHSPACDAMTMTLILLRHGESEWNAKNLFTGWVDVPLSDKGQAEAVRGGQLLADAGLLPDVLHTSVLRRAITTAHLALDACERHWIPVRRSWRLNERHYGALQGKDKKATLEAYGEEQFMLWRRSYSTPPPKIADDDEWSQVGDPRYADLPDELMPRSECLADVVERMLPYWYDAIVPDLRSGRTVCVAAHGNSLRALVKHLDDMLEEDVVGLNIPTGIPLVYALDDRMRPTVTGGRYLDPDAAASAIQAVANQGR